MVGRQDTSPSLDSYLKDNQHLFTLIGIFAALSVYLSNLPLGESQKYVPISSVAATGGFGLVILLSVVAMWNLGREVYESERRILSVKNLGLFVFAFLYFILFIAIFRAFFQFERAVGTVLVLVARYGTVLVFSVVVYWFVESGFLDALSEKLGRHRITTMLLAFGVFTVWNVVVTLLFVVSYDVNKVNSYFPAEEGLRMLISPLLAKQVLATGIRLSLLGIFVCAALRLYYWYQE